MMLQNSKSSWKGSFWDWLERGPAIPSTTDVQEGKREKYRAIFENGRLMSPSVFSESEHCELLFVVDDWGRIYVGVKEDSKDLATNNFNHASIFNGKPVASAGKLVLEHGIPIELSDHSGHYRPSLMQVEIALKTLAKHGVDIEHLLVRTKAKKRNCKSGTTCLQVTANSTS
jgi:hypothetical protein